MARGEASAALAKTNASLYAFNRGVVAAQALARVDLDRMRMSAEEQTNWLPRALGSMSLRPGLAYTGETLNSAKSISIPFVYSMTQVARIECTALVARPLIDDAPITRAAVSTAITSGTFSASTGWTLAGVGGGVASISGGVLSIACAPINSSATATQTVSVSAGDVNVEHAVRIKVTRGPILFRIGTAADKDDIMATATLDEGEHSLAFTPGTTSIYIQFESRVSREVIVDSIQIEGAGAVTIPAAWTEDDLPYIRWQQSGDIIFVAIYGKQQRKIERRGARSWSVVKYITNDGPFFPYPSESNVKLSVDNAVGPAVLTASRPFFRSNHIGVMFRLFTPGYNASFNLAQEDCYTPAVRINGVGAARTVSIVTSGTFVGNLRIQKSYVGEFTGFSTVSTVTGPATTSVTDTADNVAVWVRIGFDIGDYTSGTATAQLIYGTGGGSGGIVTSPGGRYGVCRVLSVTDDTHANVEVISALSSTLRASDWAECEWSDRQGWPSAVTIHESRIIWAGKDKIWGSISDAYYSFDPATSGDSGPLQRSIGTGPIQLINWVLPLSRLLVGTEASEVSVRSSSFDEPLTPTNFTLKDISTYGSARIAAVKADTRGLFVERAGVSLMDVGFDIQAGDYNTADLTRLCPDLFLNNAITRIAIQRKPDTRIHCLREDGTVAVIVFEPLEDVKCWWVVETDGVVEDVCILPAPIEDTVYYTVRRTINGNTKRYHERFSRENECIGETYSKNIDCHAIYAGASSTTITGLSHLEGKSVVVWANGKDFSSGDGDDQTTFVVSGGSITLPSAVTAAVIGLPYTARFKSTKLAYGAQMGTALAQRKRVNSIGLILHKTHCKGLRYGRDYDNLDDLPFVENGTQTPEDTIWGHFDEPMRTLNGNWDTDSRLCLAATAPRPCTVLAAIIQVNTSES